MRIDNFKAKSGGGKTLSVTATAQTLDTSGGQALEIFNNSVNIVYFHYTTDNSVTAATTADAGWSFCVGPGVTKMHDIPAGITKISVIAAVAGPSSVLISEGEGS